MRSPLSSRTNSRPDRVAPEDVFDLGASSTLMVRFLLSEVCLEYARRPARIGGFQVQRVSHFLFLGLQVGERVHRRLDLAGNPFGDFDAAILERTYLARIVGQQANAWNAKVAQDRGRQAEVPEVRLEPERMIGLDGIDAGVLQLVGL